MEIDNKTIKEVAIGAAVVLGLYFLFGRKKATVMAADSPTSSGPGTFPSHIYGRRGMRKGAVSNPNSFTTQPSASPVVTRWYAIENADNAAYWQNADVSNLMVQLRTGVPEYALQPFLDKYGLVLTTPIGTVPSAVSTYTFSVPSGTKDKMLQMVQDAKNNMYILVAEPAPLSLAAVKATSTDTLPVSNPTTT